ncbi:MAG: carbohydrate kinase family protein, partial [Bdellovibrionales bacterium]
SLKSKELFAGGSAANTVSGLASLGARVGFFTNVAADPIGQALIQNFKEAGVKLCCPPVDPKASLSPSCLILTTPQGERSILFHAETPTRFSDDELSAIAKTRCDYLLFEAAILLEKQNKLPALLEAVSLARKNGAKTVFNLQGSYSWTELSVLPRDVASMSDIVIGNEMEVVAFKKHVTLPSFSKQTVVMTQGQNGATLKTKEALLRVRAAPAVQVVDSIGAGDQFLAGFLHALCLGLSPKEGMKVGARTACSILGRKGGRPNAAISAALI